MKGFRDPPPSLMKKIYQNKYKFHHDSSVSDPSWKAFEDLSFEDPLKSHC